METTNASIGRRVQELMLPIPAGRVALRDDRTGRRWTAELAPFFMAKFPVTQALYRAVTCGETPSAFRGDNHPVESVSWVDAATFCNVLSVRLGLACCYAFTDSGRVAFDAEADGFRLPTEAEWEYACRAGTAGVRYGDLDAIAWYKDNSGKAPREIGQKEPNAWGLYDTLGNVWEWCSDIYDETVYGSYRVLRGGGWNDHARGCLATNRRRGHPASFRIDDLGFRVARNGNF